MVEGGIGVGKSINVHESANIGTIVINNSDVSGLNNVPLFSSSAVNKYYVDNKILYRRLITTSQSVLETDDILAIRNGNINLTLNAITGLKQYRFVAENTNVSQANPIVITSINQIANAFTGTLVNSIYITKPYNSITLYSSVEDNIWYML